VQINGSLFQGPPQPFQEDVVEVTAQPNYYLQCIGKANITRGIDTFTPASVKVVTQVAL
jgi:hypothetical protein